MVEEYEENADPPERPDDLDDDFGKNHLHPIQNSEAVRGEMFDSAALFTTDYPPGYTPEVKLSKNLIGSAKGGFTVPAQEYRRPPTTVNAGVRSLFKMPF